MNPLLATLLAALANLLAGLAAARTQGAEARAATLAGALIAAGAAAFTALPLLIHGEAVGVQALGLALRADALTATLLLPMALAVGALAVALPRQDALPRVMAAASFALAAALGVLLADTLGLLLLGELLLGLAVFWGLGAEGHPGSAPGRIARLQLAAAGMLTLAALALAGGGGGPLSQGPPVEPAVAGLLLAAVALRVGVPPAQSGLTGALRGAPGGRAALLALPFGGLTVLVRVVQPALVAYDPHRIAVVVLALAALAALTGVVARDLGRAAGWTLAALHGLLVAGNLEAAPTGPLGGELLWAAITLSEVGFVLGVILVVRRLGAVDLRVLHGLQDAAPQLGLAFLLVALTVAGVPGTLEFVAQDLLLSGVGSAGMVGVVLAVVAMAAVGFNALRLYVQVFYGPGDPARVDMDARPWERAVLLALVGLLLAGGVAPGLLPIVEQAAERIEGEVH